MFKIECQKYISYNIKDGAKKKIIINPEIITVQYTDNVKTVRNTLIIWLQEV